MKLKNYTNVFYYDNNIKQQILAGYFTVKIFKLKNK